MRSAFAVILLAFGMLVTGPALAAFNAEDATNLGTESTAILTKLGDDNSGVKAMFNHAKGILVCPDITKGGFIVGIESGKCEMRVGGEVVDYYRINAVKVGLLVGIEWYSMVLVFNDQEELDKFRTGKREWEIGADASVAIVKVGATGKLDTTNLKRAIISYVFDETGLMADISLEGANFKKIKVEE